MKIQVQHEDQGVSLVVHYADPLRRFDARLRGALRKLCP